MSKKKFKQTIAIVIIGLLAYFILMNFYIIWNAIGTFFTVGMPFIIGFCIAYLINKPYVFFSEKVLVSLKNSKSKFFRTSRKPISLFLAYAIVFGVVIFLISIIVPQLVESFNMLSSNFSSYAETFKNWLLDVSAKYLKIELKEDNDLFTMVNNLVKIITGEELKNYFTKMANTFAPDMFNVATQFTTNLYNIGIGIVISFYYLACKEKLIFQTKKVAFAFISEKYLPKIFDITNLSNRMFGRYVYGRIIDSFIMGVLCFIGMSIFNFDYAMLISVVVGITNIIPMFGPFIGAVPSILILLIINPLEALWFTVFIFALQQIDGNLIGPKVVGNSIGISGFWIMASVIIGGGLFGVVGMFIAVPVFAIIYSFTGEVVNGKLSEKNRLQLLGSSPDSDIITDAEKPTIDFNDIKLYKTILKNVKEKTSHKTSKHHNDDNQ